MDRNSWLEWRRTGIGGSDVAAILGLSPWRTPWDVWASKRFEQNDTRSNASMNTGNRLELAVMQYAADDHEAQLVQTPTQLQQGWKLGTPDGWLAYDDGSVRGLEAKVAEYPWEQVPEHYLTQVRWYMHVGNVEQWVVAAFFRMAPAWRTYIVDRDLDIEREMVAKVEAWHKRHIVEGVQPDIDASPGCAKGLRQVHSEPETDRRVATREEIEMVFNLHDLDRTLEQLEQERALYANRLRASIGDAPGIRWTGGRANWSRRNGRVTYRIDKL